MSPLQGSLVDASRAYGEGKAGAMPLTWKCILKTLAVIFAVAGIWKWSIKLLITAAVGAVTSEANRPVMVAAFVVIPPVGVAVALMDAVSGRSSGGLYMTPGDILWPAAVVATPGLGLCLAAMNVFAPRPQTDGGQVVLQLQNAPLQV